MIKLGEWTYNRRDFLLLLIVTLALWIGFWNISILLLPLALGLLISMISTKGFKTTRFPAFSWIGGSLFLLIFTEIINYFISIYPPNTFVSLEKIIGFASLYYAMRLLLQKDNSRQFFFTGMGAYGLVLALGAFFTFLLLQTQLQLEGWQDVTQFKRLFAPFGLLNNEWASIALCFLPFPLLAAVYFRQSKIALITSVLAFSVVNAGVLISFSRGAYLSLGLFWLLTIGSILYFKLLSSKYLFRGVTVIMLGTILSMTPARTPFFTTLAMNKTVSQQRSTQGRIEILQNSLCQAKGHLIFGVGSNNYTIINDLCKKPREDQGYSGFTNNTYLQLLLEKGIFGVLVYGLFFLAIMIHFIKNIIGSGNQTERLVNAILLAGFGTFCFRELFFSSFLYSDGVMTLVSIFAAASASESGWNSSKNNRLWLLFSIFLFIVISWVLYQKINYNKAESIVQQAITAWDKGDRQAALTKVEKAMHLAPDVAPYPALGGLIQAKTHVPLSDLLNTPLPNDTIFITKAIEYFTSALQLNPLDAGYHFNLGWLYFLQNQASEKGLEQVNRALELEPNNSEFLIGKGLLLEYNKETGAAFEVYKKAIRLDPEILDSKFFADLIARHPPAFKEVFGKPVDALNTNKSTIIAARLGKILLNGGYYKEAKKILQQVTQELPDLNRPYYYLAFLAKREGDTTQAIALLQKAIYLDKKDYLPPLEMGNIYYKRQRNQKNSAFTIIRYYKNALQNWLGSSTNHHVRANIKYKNNTNIKNDLIPADLLLATKTPLDFPLITTRIAEMYAQLGNPADAQYYRALSQKALSAIKAEDIK